ncbi:MAG TPA: class I SAM-dependent methyltransferase [Acidimicrobiales bacterium]|nr:class I SAM-dependent methyltransferase [Acidimicrobiales bacterium]
MDGFDPASSFGPDVAERYDDELRGDEDDTVAFLSRLAGEGPALELAIGTGRIALPLAANGLRVDGIELSAAMVDILRTKPGGDKVHVTIGDFADVPIEGQYRLIFVVFNTLFNLLTQDDQVRCFQNVAAHLDSGGLFVIEAFTPGYLLRLRDNQYVDAERITVGEVRLDVGRHDAVAQTLDESHVTITAQGIRLGPIVTRYAWPSELDLMARLAGLRLAGRWAGWNNEPFTSDSRRHVSVYER